MRVTLDGLLTAAFFAAICIFSADVIYTTVVLIDEVNEIAATCEGGD